MASFSPRASRLTLEPSMSRSYDDDVEQPRTGLSDLPNDCRTPVRLCQLIQMALLITHAIAG